VLRSEALLRRVVQTCLGVLKCLIRVFVSFVFQISINRKVGSHEKSRIDLSALPFAAGWQPQAQLGDGFAQLSKN